jgi:hypothetical protein
MGREDRRDERTVGYVTGKGTSRGERKGWREDRDR